MGKEKLIYSELMIVILGSIVTARIVRDIFLMLIQVEQGYTLFTVKVGGFLFVW